MSLSDLRPPRPWDRTPPSERDYFEILGPGVVAARAPRSPDSLPSGGWRPPTGGAWIHVGEDGRVRAFTGKVEVGQGTRAALTLVVATELQIDPSAVEVVMGDTDLCPWDMGTFGSRSMPDALPALRSAASALRSSLLALAAQRLGSAESQLDLAAGEVRPRVGGAPLPLGLLVRGRRTVVDVPSVPQGAGTEEAEPPGPAGPAAFRESSATEVVTGARRYGSDLRSPGLLEGRVLRPPTYGARLREVRLEGARGVPGVTVFRDGEFVGVVAPTFSEAQQALGEIRAQWTPSEAPDEAEIEAYLRTHPLEGDSWDTDEDLSGDVAAALAACVARSEATYRTAYLAHVPLEPHGAVARWDAHRLTIWLGTQTPFRARDQVSQALGLPVEDVRIVVPPTGAGFGGKHGGDIALAAARLARAAGHPVRVRFTREDEFRFGYFRPMSLVDVRAGVDRDGHLSAWEFQNVNGGAAALTTPYRTRARRIRNTLSRSPLPQGSYRSLGAVANNFAREVTIDELAHATRVDPVRFRRENLDDARLLSVLERASRRAGWADWQPRPGRGHGVAVGSEKGSRIATIAEVTVADDRRVRVDRLVAAFEAGRVVHRDNLSSQVEGALVMALGGALFEAVRFEPGVVRNAHLAQYRVPRFSDLPELLVEVVDAPELPPAGGGETPMIAVAPALANAIYDATELRLRTLPLLPTGRLPVPGFA